MELLINNLTSSEVITSSNFAKKSNVIYSEIVSHGEYENISNKNTFVISQNDKEVLYKNNHFEIKENDVIFCNSYLINDLFKMLNETKGFNNLKLITGQTDHKITKSIFLNKPKCISKWFAVNVAYQTNELIPIPLGLSNNVAGKNLNKDNYLRLIQKMRKKNIIYSNFEINTNYFHRRQFLKNYYINNPEYNFELEKINFDQYVENLNEFEYILCPWGNGIDTHRVWETLYANSIPIVKNHITYKTLDHLNAIKVRNYKDITIDSLENKKNKDTDESFLNIDSWMNLIHKDKIERFNEIKINDNQEKNRKIKLNFHKKIKKEKKIKNLLTALRKIDQKKFIS